MMGCFLHNQTGFPVEQFSFGLQEIVHCHIIICQVVNSYMTPSLVFRVKNDYESHSTMLCSFDFLIMCCMFVAYSLSARYLSLSLCSSLSVVPLQVQEAVSLVLISAWMSVLRNVRRLVNSLSSVFS